MILSVFSFLHLPISRGISIRYLPIHKALIVSVTPCFPVPCNARTQAEEIFYHWVYSKCSYVSLTVHLSIFIPLFNQLDAQNLFHNKFYFMHLHVSSKCTHHQEVKIALHSIWYHQTYRRPSRAQVETSTYMCDDTRGCVMQFWLPNYEHMCSKHVEAWNKNLL